MQRGSVIEELKRLGLSEYESKAYAGLLEHHPSNGYHLSKQTGIPRSRIYDVLRALLQKQLVFEGEEEGQFFPLEPDRLVFKLKTDYQELFTNIERHTRELYKRSETLHSLRYVRGRKEIMELSCMLIDQAKERIALSVWQDEMPDLESVLSRAEQRGVTLRGIFFGSRRPFRGLMCHRRIERYLSEKQDRYMIISIDGDHILSGIVSRDSESRVSWTSDPGLIDIGEDYIAHDLMINAYADRLDGDALSEFEHYLDNVRGEFYGKKAIDS